MTGTVGTSSTTIIRISTVVVDAATVVVAAAIGSVFAIMGICGWYRRGWEKHPPSTEGIFVESVYDLNAAEGHGEERFDSVCLSWQG